jgi:hypothetical protein
VLQLIRHTKFVKISLLRISLIYHLSHIKFVISRTSSSLFNQSKCLADPSQLSQKITLRTQRRHHPLHSYKQLANWFYEAYDHRLSQSTISEILSSRYLHLDTATDLSDHQCNAKRIRIARWPDLEKALLNWIKLAENHIPITQEVIREKARFFWSQIPLYEGVEMPAFSNGWLAGFQHRESIRNRLQYGDDRSTPELASEAMIPIRQALESYSPRDIFNCDETGLFWKRIPDRSLSTRSLPGSKKEKARITALFCTHSDGSEKLKPWFIGTAKNPRAFTTTGININNLNIRWKSNSKAWMTSEIFEDWLRWFDASMRHRKVVLLLDNFSAHESAVKAINNSLPLQNTLIIWLPPNSTSRFQPLDQGIINTWKAYWKRQWVKFIVSEFDEGRDPMLSMNVLKAVQWGIQAWELDISASTIKNCFQKGSQCHLILVVVILLLVLNL